MRIRRPIYPKVHWDEFIKLAGNYYSLSAGSLFINFPLIQSLTSDFITENYLYRLHACKK